MALIQGSAMQGFTPAGTPAMPFDTNGGMTTRQSGGGGMFGPRVQAGQWSDANGSLLGARANWGANNTGVNLAPPPHISANPIWTGQQIDQRVNSMRASNDASAATSTRNTNNNLAAKGFGSNSPLAQALSAQYAGQALGANTQGENDVRWNAAQGNAQQVLAGQQAQSNQWNQQNQQLIAKQQQQYGNQYTLMNMLSGMM